jgi:hypothetical protein
MTQRSYVLSTPKICCGLDKMNFTYMHHTRLLPAAVSGARTGSEFVARIDPLFRASLVSEPLPTPRAHHYSNLCRGTYSPFLRADYSYQRVYQLNKSVVVISTRLRDHSGKK